RVVAMPDDKVLLREVCSADGTVKILDGDGKELSVRKGTLAPAKAPALEADTKDLVVLPLPFRSPAQVRKERKLDNKDPGNLRFEDGLALFAAHVGAGEGQEAENVFQRCFLNRNQRQLGFYVLLAACGQNLDAEHGNVLAEHLDEPLAQYLA